MSENGRRAGILLVFAPALGFGPTLRAERVPAARFPVQSVAGGSFVPGHSSLSGDPSDAAAAKRRLEVLRSPYDQIAERRSLRGGEIVAGFEASFSPESRERIAKGLTAASNALFDRDGWSRPFSTRSPLEVAVTRHREDTPGVAGWDGRDGGLLVHPVIRVDAGTGDDDSVLLDAVHQLALLSVRQSGPEEAGWAAEGLAEWLARRALGFDGELLPDSDPFLDEEGALTSSPALTAFLDAVARRLPRGETDVRDAWDAAGAARGDDAMSFVRDVAGRADPRGLAGLLSDLVAGRLGRSAPGHPHGAAPGLRRGLAPGEWSTGSPAPLGWRRVSFATPDEQGGLEVLLPEGAGATAGRVVLLYRGFRGGFDSISLVPGTAATVPLSGAVEIDLVVVDGAEPGDLAVRLRRVSDYPAALVSGGAEWRDDAVQVSWRTSSHRDLLAWIVVRLEETDEGGLREVGREMVPTASDSETGFGYEIADHEARVGHRYRYRVYALTSGGALSEAFEAAVVPGR